MSQTKFVENIKEHILCLIIFSRNRNFYETMWKNMLEPDRRQGNTVHAHGLLDKWGYKHILRICNNSCFSAVKLVRRKPVNFPLYVHRRSCLLISDGLTVCLCRNAVFDGSSIDSPETWTNRGYWCDNIVGKSQVLGDKPSPVLLCPTNAHA